MTNQIYYKIKIENKKQEQEKSYRERKEEMDLIKEREKNRILEELKIKIDIASENIGISNIIEISKIYDIIDEIRNEKTKPRKFN